MRMHCEKICVRVWIEETVVTMTTRCSISPEHSQYYSSISGWSFVLRTGDTLWHHQLSPVTITESNGQSQTTQNMAAFKNTCSSRKKNIRGVREKKKSRRIKIAHWRWLRNCIFFPHAYTLLWEWVSWNINVTMAITVRGSKHSTLHFAARILPNANNNFASHKKTHTHTSMH